jgi:hypothetical protein
VSRPPKTGRERGKPSSRCHADRGSRHSDSDGAAGRRLTGPDVQHGLPHSYAATVALIGFVHTACAASSGGASSAGCPRCRRHRGGRCGGRWGCSSGRGLLFVGPVRRLACTQWTAWRVQVGGALNDAPAGLTTRKSTPHHHTHWQFRLPSATPRSPAPAQSTPQPHPMHPHTPTMICAPVHAAGGHHMKPTACPPPPHLNQCATHRTPPHPTLTILCIRVHAAGAHLNLHGHAARPHDRGVQALVPRGLQAGVRSREAGRQGQAG